MFKSSKQKKLKRIFKWVLWILLFQFVLINFSASLHAWKQTHFYTDPGLRIYKPPSKNIFLKTWKLFAGIKMPRSVVHTFPTFPFDTVILKTSNGLKIDGWYSRPDSMAKGTVILFHGWSINKGYILPEAEEFRYLGYNVLLVDLRGHGNSDGNTTSIGYYESEEVKLAYDYIKEKGEKNIFLWGMSLGSVIIAKALNDYNLQPTAVILEMPFYSLQSFLEGRSKLFGFPGEPFGFLVTAWTGIESGYNGFGFKVAEYAKKIHCPALLQWGTQDPFISVEQGKEIFDNIPGTKKKLIIHEGAGHQSFLQLDPVQWRMEMESLLRHPDSLCCAD